ncbi:hypothetical protein S35_1434 [Escherichia coli B104]|nr:hypothetical protein S35_1434 [Escherichia coli B104]
MTAMMVLFLVVMVASLSSVTQRIQRAEQGEKARGQDISRLCERLELHARNVNKNIDEPYQLFPERRGEKALQDVVPLVLEASNSEEGRSGLSRSLLKGPLIKKFASWLCHYDPALNSLSQRIAARLSSSQRDDHYLHNDFHALTAATLDMEKRLIKNPRHKKCGWRLSVPVSEQN